MDSLAVYPPTATILTRTQEGMGMDELLNDLMSTIIRIKEKAKEENICADDYETMILETLDSVGIEFSR